MAEWSGIVKETQAHFEYFELTATVVFKQEEGEHIKPLELIMELIENQLVEDKRDILY